ncbi:RICIN domain-containing protein [Streptomyces uncialis]|uniref:RICIN domain-containing protein n=1 Tax=Streptomyces uncialis TaxID=1048205 RepID=UPI0033F851D4
MPSRIAGLGLGCLMLMAPYSVLPAAAGPSNAIGSAAPGTGTVERSGPGGARSSVAATGILIQNARSNKCLEIYSSQTRNGAIAVQWGCHGGANQRWLLNCWEGCNENALFTLVNAHSRKCLEVAGSSTANKARVQQWDCHGGRNQVWQRTRSSGGFDPSLYWNQASNKVMEVYDNSTADGASVVQWDAHGANNQYWYHR